MENKKLVNDINRLTELEISMTFPFREFARHLHTAFGENTINDECGQSSYESALKNLSDIEDAIKRFRENRPQSYQEEK